MDAPPAQAPRMLVVDDHAVVRLGLVHLLQQLRPDHTVVSVPDLPSALATLQAHPDVRLVVLDVHLPELPPLAALETLRTQHPMVPVAMISADSDPQLASQALRLGAAGWLPKAADARLLASALGLMLDGGVYVPPFLLQPPPAPAEPLTSRQLEVLAQLVQGRSNKEIARSLGMAEPTVKGHLVTIFRVLRVRNRAEAALAGQTRLRGGLDSPR